MTTQSQSLRLADRLARHPYAWPGGYPCYAITNDGAALCRHCGNRIESAYVEDQATQSQEVAE